MFRKKLLLLGLTSVLACISIFASGTNEKENDEDSQVVVEIFHHKVPWIDAWQSMSEDYEATHNNVKLETEIVGGSSDWRTLLKTKFTANKAPDIFIIEGESDYQLWKDYIEHLDNEEWTEHLLPIAEESATKEGHIIGVPLTIEGYGYIYNKDLFEKAGITTLPENFSEMEKVVKTLKDNDITPFASGFGTWWVISNHFTNIPFAQQEDPMGYINKLNNGETTITDNPIFNEWKKSFDLVINNSEENPLTCDHQMQVSKLANNEVAMIQQGNWKQAPLYDTNKDLNIGLLPIFLGNDKATANRIPVGIPFMLCINSDSPENEKAAAKEFINWLLTSNEGKAYLANEFEVIPAYDNIEPSSNMGGVSTDILKFAQEGKTIPWTFSYWPDGAVNEFSDFAQKYVAQIDSFDQYLSNLQNSWNKLNK
ncbi:MAG: ABC transporter substrate-binding protein [Sphaerochaetaceae bacterium]|nr:ABC transporter substrate-binding protein [Sphaerochaetaceae bacterium]